MDSVVYFNVKYQILFNNEYHNPIRQDINIEKEIKFLLMIRDLLKLYLFMKIEKDIQFKKMNIEMRLML